MIQDKSVLAQESCEPVPAAAPPSTAQARSLQPPFKLNRWTLMTLGGLLLLSGLAVGVPRLLNANSSANRPTEGRILSVKTAPVTAVMAYSTTQMYTGEVAAMRASELGFERSGKLVWLGADQGDRVTAGTPIAKLDTQNLVAQRQQLLAQKAQALAVLQELQNGPRNEVIAAAQAEVGNLQNQVQLEQIKRDRREYLYDEGAISREQLDETTFNQGALSKRLAATQSQLDELKNGTRPEQIAAQQAAVKQLEASIADLEITIAKSTITAPFSGAIAERRFDEGTVVNAGQSIVRLVEAASPEVEIGVPADLVAQLKIGSSQQIQIGQKPYPATVTSIKPEINSATRTRTIILTLDPSVQSAVAPKQIARLAVTQTVPTRGYWLPTTALVRGDRGLWSCYAIVQSASTSPASAANPPYRVERRDVEVLHTESTPTGKTPRALVRGTLKPDDIVISNGTQRIVPGQLVNLAD